MTSSSASKDTVKASNYLSDVQGLRAIAVTLVVLAHAGVPGISGGFIGVDVFFVLSGYLITGLLVAEIEDEGGIRFADFYARRFKRLLPALVVMVTGCYIAASLLLSSYETTEMTRSAMFASTWTSNLFFAFRDIDYFNELETVDLFLHTWSLGVEEQFYLIWPFTLAVLYLAIRRLGSTGKGTGMTIAALLAIGAASWLLNQYWLQHRPMFAYYQMPARIWQFALGAVVFLAIRRQGTPRLQATQRRFSGLAGIAIIIYAAIIITPVTPYPGAWALLPSAGAALVLASVYPGTTSAILSNRLMTWLGDRSYAWYLWHWPVLKIGAAMGADSGALSTVALILLSLVIAALTYHLIERPLWRGKWSTFSNARTIAASCLTMALMGGLFLQLAKTPEPVDSASLAGNVQASVSDLPIIYQYNCDTWYHSAELTPCTFRDPSYQRTVVLLGDSVLAQWFSLFADIYSPPEWQLIVLTKSACPMVDEDFFYQRIGRNFDICKTWRNSALDYIGELRPDIVIVGGAAGNPFSGAQFENGSARIIQRLSEASGEVLVVPGTPKLTFNGPGCLLRELENSGESTSFTYLAQRCTSQANAELVQGKTELLKQAVANMDNATVLDLNPLVCPDGVCTAITSGGLVVFRDGQHLADQFVRSLVPSVQRQIERLARPP